MDIKKSDSENVYSSLKGLGAIDIRITLQKYIFWGKGLTWENRTRGIADPFAAAGGRMEMRFTPTRGTLAGG